MKKTIFIILLSLSCLSSAFAFNSENFPEYFSIKNDPKCQYGCVHLLAQNKQPIGSMKLASNKSGTFFLFDEKGQHLVSLQTKKIGFLAIVTNFDIFDNHNNKIAKAIIFRNQKSGQLISFEIYAANGETPIVTGSSSITGIKHTIYLKKSNHVLAEITRPLFTFSRDSDAHIIDKTTLSTVIDLNVFTAVMSFYCSNYILQVDESEEIDLPVGAREYQELNEVEAKLKQVFNAHGFTLEELKTLSKEQLQEAANILNERYHQTYDDSQLSDEEKIVQFVRFGYDLILSNSYDSLQEKAMLKFLALKVAEFRLDAVLLDKKIKIKKLKNFKKEGVH